MPTFCVLLFTLMGVSVACIFLSYDQHPRSQAPHSLISARAWLFLQVLSREIVEFQLNFRNTTKHMFLGQHIIIDHHHHHVARQ
uniref:Putative secreted protein n=1 Tax=Anopheles darlingi TaxID=43151 RepID=A0A2M4DI30_ANODA